MPVWNPKAINYDEPIIKSPDGRLIGTVIGAWVMTKEEANKHLQRRGLI